MQRMLYTLLATTFATAAAMQIHRKQSADATECALYLTDTLAAGCQRCVRCAKKQRRGRSGFGSLIATGLETGAATLSSLSSYCNSYSHSHSLWQWQDQVPCSTHKYTSRVCEIKTCLFAVFGDLHIFLFCFCFCARDKMNVVFVQWNCGSRCLADLIKRYQNVWAAHQALHGTHWTVKITFFRAENQRKFMKRTNTNAACLSRWKAAAANGQCLMAWKGAANALDYSQVGSTLVVVVEDAHTRCSRSGPQCYQEIVTLVENHDRKFQHLNYLNLATATTTTTHLSSSFMATNSDSAEANLQLAWRKLSGNMCAVR